MIITVKVKKDSVKDSWMFTGNTEPSEGAVRLKVILEDMNFCIFDGGVIDGVNKLKEFIPAFKK